MAHEHNSSVAMPTQMIYVEDADFPTLTTGNSFDIAYAFLCLGISLGIRSVDLFQCISVQTGQRGSRLVYCDVMLCEDRVKSCAKKWSRYMAALVSTFMRAYNISQIIFRRIGYSHRRTTARYGRVQLLLRPTVSAFTLFLPLRPTPGASNPSQISWAP